MKTRATLHRMAIAIVVLTVLAAGCASQTETDDLGANPPDATEATDPGPADTDEDSAEEDSAEDEAPAEDSTEEEPPADEAAAEDTAELRLGVVGVSMQMTFAPYTSVPIDQGFFAAEGLLVDVIGMPGSSEAVDGVLAGQLDAALILSPAVLKAIETGADVQVFYNHITRNFAVPEVGEDSSIQTVADLEGATVGVVSPGAGSIPQIRALVQRAGGDPESMEFLPVGAGPDVAELLRNGSIDVAGLWDSVFASIEGVGVPLRPVSEPWFDDLGFQGVFVASREALAADPDVFARFGRAVAQATVFTEANPDAAIASHWAVYPDSKPAGLDDDAALAVGRAALEARLPSLVEPDTGWGGAAPVEIEELQAVLVEGGFLEAVMPVDQIWTDALLEQINDFDEAAVVTAAEGASG